MQCLVTLFLLLPTTIYSEQFVPILFLDIEFYRVYRKYYTESDLIKWQFSSAVY
jgi:hypothetical protein